MDTSAYIYLLRVFCNIHDIAMAVLIFNIMSLFFIDFIGGVCFDAERYIAYRKKLSTYIKYTVLTTNIAILLYIITPDSATADLLLTTITK